MGDQQVTTAEPHAASTQLIQVLRTYCLGLQGSALRDLRDSMARGHYRWLREELHAALADGVFTPGDWARYVGSTPAAEAGPRAMRRQQEQVWSVLFPDHPFPQRSSAAV